MIADIYMEIIVLLMLIYIIDTKILPQIILMFLAIAMMIHQISIATNLQSMIGVLLIYAVVIVYSSLQITLAGKDEV